MRMHSGAQLDFHVSKSIQLIDISVALRRVRGNDVIFCIPVFLRIWWGWFLSVGITGPLVKNL